MHTCPCEASRALPPHPSPPHLSSAAWLVKHQPITLSINGATGDADYTAALHARVHATADDALPVAEHLRWVAQGGG